MTAADKIIEAIVAASALSSREQYFMRETFYSLVRVVQIESAQQMQHNLDILCEPTENAWLQ